MKQLDIKQHTKKYMNLAKKASNGSYPNQKIAKIGSTVGLGIGCILLVIGIFGITQNTVFSVGILIAGAVTCVSNCINFKRIKRKN